MTDAGYGTRLASVADHAACARLFLELRVPDPPFTVEIFETLLLPGVVVAEDAGGVIGYVAWRLYGDVAHVMHVAVDASARGRGVGAALLEAARGHLAACTRWYLNVKQDNHAAIRLYERAGFAVELESTSLFVPWAAVAQLPTDPAVTAARAQERDDARIATALGLPIERVTFSRTRPGYLCTVLTDAHDDVVAFAAFDPAYNGAYPFAALRPRFMRPLLEAIRPDARPAHDGVNVAVEGDRPLVQALTAVGARINFELYRMAAALSA